MVWTLSYNQTHAINASDIFLADNDVFFVMRSDRTYLEAWNKTFTTKLSEISIGFTADSWGRIRISVPAWDKSLVAVAGSSDTVIRTRLYRYNYTTNTFSTIDVSSNLDSFYSNFLTERTRPFVYKVGTNLGVGASFMMTVSPNRYYIVGRSEGGATWQSTDYGADYEGKMCGFCSDNNDPTKLIGNWTASYNFKKRNMTSSGYDTTDLWTASVNGTYRGGVVGISDSVIQISPNGLQRVSYSGSVILAENRSAMDGGSGFSTCVGENCFIATNRVSGNIIRLHIWDTSNNLQFTNTTFDCGNANTSSAVEKGGKLFITSTSGILEYTIVGLSMLSITPDPSSHDFGTVYVNQPSSAVEITATVVGTATNMLVEAFTGFEYSATEAGTYTSTLSLGTVTDSTATFWIRCNSASAGSLSGNVTITCDEEVDGLVAVTATVSLPVITASPDLLNFGTLDKDSIATASFNLSVTGVTSGIEIVSSNTKVKLSVDEVNWYSTLSFGTEFYTPVYVQVTASDLTPINEVLSITSVEGASENVTVYARVFANRIITADSINFGYCEQTSVKSDTANIYNAGTEKVTYTGISSDKQWYSPTNKSGTLFPDFPAVGTKIYFDAFNRITNHAGQWNLEPLGYGEAGEITSLGLEVTKASHFFDNKKISLGQSGGIYVSGTTLQTFGGNEELELGIGSSSPAYSEDPVDVDVTGVLSGKVIKQVIGGSYCKYIIDEDFKLYSFGLNDAGQLGDNSTTSRSSAAAVNTTSFNYYGSGKILKVVAAYEGALALDSEGKVFGWGSGTYGFLQGLQTGTYATTPGFMSKLTTRIVDIAAGSYNAAVLDENGDVWTWGDNSVGQLGLGATGSYSVNPSKVDLGSRKVSKIYAKGTAVYAITTDGAVLAWGQNNYGQLCLGNASTAEAYPSECIISDVIDLACDGDTVIMLKSNGELWSVGRNDSGQLGVGTTTTYEISPSEITAVTGAVKLTAGTSCFGFIKSDGVPYVWGDNYNGKLGLGDTVARDEPAEWGA